MTAAGRKPDDPLPLHLILLVLYLPLVTTLVHVPFEPPGAGVRSTLIIGAGALGLCTLLVRASRNLLGASAATSILLFGFCFDRWLRLAPGAIHAALWAALLTVAVAVAVTRRSLSRQTRHANLFLTVFIVAIAATIGWHEVRPSSPGINWPHVRAQLNSPPTRSGNSARPDVYIVVVDGYARADVLQSRYRYRDSLPSELRERGFLVPDRAFSNYAQTVLSLASSLNFDYLPALLTDLTPNLFSRRSCTRLIRRSSVADLFRSAGYRIVAFASEYAPIHIEKADETHRWSLHQTEFEYAMYDHSVLPTLARLLGLPQAWLPHNLRRLDLEWTFRRLARLDLPAAQPALVFVHLLLPHPPFTFLPDGRYSSTKMPANAGDGAQLVQLSGGETYELGYVRNLRYLRSRLLPVVDAILSRPARRSILLIYGDHGPGSRLDWNSPESSDVSERMGILLGLRFCDAKPTSPVPISPVNAIRLVASEALRVDLPPIEDTAWFSGWQRPYDFKDVTASVR